MKSNKNLMEAPEGVVIRKDFDPDNWKPKTQLGKLVKAGTITSLDEIMDQGHKILEPEIVDFLMPDLEKDLLTIGQSKGKFGGGKGSIWRQTQKKTKEGNNISFCAGVIIGNRNGYIGLGFGKARETVPAREKAIRQAKLNLIKIRRGCGSWACNCKTAHSIPYKSTGSSGSIRLTLIPAPKGTDLVISKECKKIFKFVGIKDVYSETYGHTATKLNLVKACFESLKSLTKTKVLPVTSEKLGIKEGSM